MRARRAGTLVGTALGASLLMVPLFAGTAAASPVATGTIAVCLTDSAGANVTLGSDQAWYQVGQGSIGYVGPVSNDTGCRESTVTGSQVTVWVGKDGTRSEHETVAVPDGGTTRVDFYTTNVTIQYPGQVAYGGPTGDSAWFKQTTATASKELLSDGTTPTVFRMSTPAGQVRTPVSWPVATGTGKSATFSLMAMQVLNNDGTGESGATAVYTPNQYSYFVPGSTDANGLLGWSKSGLLGNVGVTAKVNDTTQLQTQDVSTNGLFRFQTTNLTLHYNGGIRYFYNSQYADFFTQPSMEMFAGTYPFQFRSDSATGNPDAAYTQSDITVPDPANGPVTKSAAVVRFQDSTGAGLVGSVSYYLGGWNSGGGTNMSAGYFDLPANTGNLPGSAVVLFNGMPTNVVFALTYNGTRQQLAAQNIQTNSVAYFHTTAVTVPLLGSNGLSLNTGEASYYAGGWHDIGSTSYGAPQVQMLPGSYSFAMTYQGTREQLNSQTVSGAASTVTFQAADVVMALVNSTGDPIKDGGGVASYYAGGWHVVGSTNTSDGRVHAQMLPGSYSFAMTYQGTREQLNSQTVPNTANSPVTFQTGTVHSNNNVATSYYASGWKPFTQDMQLLPGNYTFHFSDGTPNTVVTVNGGVVNNIN